MSIIRKLAARDELHISGPCTIRLLRIERSRAVLGIEASKHVAVSPVQVPMKPVRLPPKRRLR